MDPIDYVKVKCIASATRSESTLVKGVVCTKNIKHKRMTSQYKNARLLILGGALEYQRAANQLASFDTLLQQDLLFREFQDFQSRTFQTLSVVKYCNVNIRLVQVASGTFGVNCQSAAFC